MSRVLVVSNGPVPAQPGLKIEGSGQRSWGVAKGLASKGYQVTVAVRDHYKFKEPMKTNGITLLNWSPGNSLIQLANQFDTVIISYSTGIIAAKLARKIHPSVSLILDCYVPIYVELSARNTPNQRQALANYLIDLKYFNTSLERGDYFLCANEPQRHLYTGALSALGVINPHSYHQNRIIELPFGISSEPAVSNTNPYKSLNIPEQEFVLLWFGGLYPWFDITALLASVGTLRSQGKNLSLVVVGGKNPYNTNPEFTSQYDIAVEYCRKNKLENNGIHFVDWVDYESRIDWYVHADAVININHAGKENEYSWRTRLMDYVWGGVPIITNGGDPLSENLIGRDAALRLPSTEEKELTSFLSALIGKDSDELKRISKNLKELRKDFFWEKLVEPLIIAMTNNPNPYLEERNYLRSVRSKHIKAKLASGRLGSGLSLSKKAVVKMTRRGRKARKNE